MKEDKTQEFNAIKKVQTVSRKGLFIAAFVISLVIAAALLSVMLIDYRGRTITEGDAGSIFNFSLTDSTALLTLFGYDLTIDRSLLKNIGGELTQIGEYVYNSVPLFIRLAIKKIPYYFNLLCGVFCEIYSLIFT